MKSVLHQGNLQNIVPKKKESRQTLLQPNCVLFVCNGSPATENAMNTYRNTTIMNTAETVSTSATQVIHSEHTQKYATSQQTKAKRRRRSQISILPTRH